MPEYRRNKVPGGTFFFTVNLLDRRSDLLVRHIEVLREAVRRAHLRTPFRIDAWAPKFFHEMRRLAVQGGDDVGIPPQGAQQVLHSPAVDNGEGMQQHLTVHHFGQQVARRDSGLNFILSRFDRRREMAQARIHHPCPRAGDHTLRRQFRREPSEARARSYLESQRRSEARWFIETAKPKPDNGGTRAQQQQAEHQPDAQQTPHNESNRLRS